MTTFQEHALIDPSGTVADVVAAARSIDAARLCTELAAATGNPQVLGRRELSTPDLVAHIVATHHALLRDTLPWLETLASKVARVHGGHDPRLVEVDRTVHDLSPLLLGHLDDEERTLFPVLSAASTEPEQVAQLLEDMRADHHEVAARLERLRELTDDLMPPAWACRTYRTLLVELARVAADIHVHVHLENHILAGRFSADRSAP